MNVLSLNIAVIGSGAAAVGVTQALRHAEHLTDDSARLAPHVTVFEGSATVGGKMAKHNLGAQFLDEHGSYPMLGIVQNLGLRLHRSRPDYDDAPYLLRSGQTMPAKEFKRALVNVRDSCRRALHDPGKISELDQMGAIGFLHTLKRQGVLDRNEVEAISSRTKFEEGTVRMSALAFAINLAKGKTPMRRLEVRGGLHQVAVAEMAEVQNSGGAVHLHSPVHRIQATQDGVNVFVDGKNTPQKFDYAFVALAPEHYSNIYIGQSLMPHDLLEELLPARITKTNIVLPRNSRMPSELACEDFALWLTPGDVVVPDKKGAARRKAATFFHGWQGQRRLTDNQLRAHLKLGGVVKLPVESQTWDGKVHTPGDIPHAYTTMPMRNQALQLYEWVYRYYVLGEFDAERIHFANHVLGAGCYTHNAALSGELAVLSLLRGLGFNVARYSARVPDIQKALFGARLF